MLYLDASGNLISRQTGFQGQEQLMSFAGNLLDVIQDESTSTLLQNSETLKHSERQELLHSLIGIDPYRIVVHRFN